MSSSIPVKKPTRADWLASGPGLGLRQLVCQHLEQHSDRFYGRFMVQLGEASPEVTMPGVRKLVFLADASGPGVDVIGDSSRLPFASSSANVVFLNHALESATDPHRLLREVDRILIPGGRLAIALYNPLGFFGLWRFMRPGHYPWQARWRSQARVVEWLSVLGFELEQREYLGHQLPFQNPILSQANAYLERLGSRLWPKAAAVVMLLAIKREMPPNIIRPRWLSQPKSGLVVGTVVEPRMRKKHNG